ncbi:GntR family transcriptional regulator [Curtobacterium sp. Leaf261]|uniref:GntR family transcriptional regulator n=1 Tax=Curtobacterium sp. Leaf261 TaxID=1736311 RepID=UPI000700EAF6|nr:GntR family transcriptional regulator [Curtobacterium sp. Leaf261]KQO63792.1 hypothetical protein ASF23_06175 [Curtobacterium sp. Leaf261]
MPVPKATTDTSPRRLLRDVVFDKLLAAIQDGTLQPGERLNDDDLVQWLGVSRTPIREAIARLVEYGLIEMEANRYTRIATPTFDQFDDARQVLFGFMEMSTRWTLPKLTDQSFAALEEILDAAQHNARTEDRGLSRDITQLARFLVQESDNELLVQLAESLIPRVEFLSLIAADRMFWDVTTPLDTYRRAAEKRDGDAGAAVVRAMSAAVDGMVADLRSSEAS